MLLKIDLQLHARIQKFPMIRSLLLRLGHLQASQLQQRVKFKLGLPSLRYLVRTG